MRRSAAAEPDSPQAAWAAGTRMLARRDLTVSQLRARLLQKGFSPGPVGDAIERLLASGSLDDARVARASAQTRLQVKRQGRDRVRRELAALGIDRDVADQAVTDVFGAADEQALLERALERRLRPGMSLDDPAVRRRLCSALVRQGFSPGAILDALRRRGASSE